MHNKIKNVTKVDIEKIRACRIVQVRCRGPKCRGATHTPHVTDTEKYQFEFNSDPCILSFVCLCWPWLTLNRSTNMVPSKSKGFSKKYSEY